MNSIQRRPLLRVSLAALLAGAWPARGESEPLAALLNHRLASEGVALAVAQIDERGHLKVASASRKPSDTPDPERSAFEIGSITKTFTALLLADAVVRGELRLEDAVETQLPNGVKLRDSAGQPLRWVDLATHRSGLPRLPPNFVPRTVSDPYADFDSAALLAALQSWQPTRRRDEAFEYSNFAYGLLGWLLARRAAQPYAQLLEQRVLTPIGLGGATGMGPLGRSTTALQGHDAQGQPVAAWQFDALAGAGALRASATQLARYAQSALAQGEHPLQAAFALAFTVHSELGPAPGVRMGLGWMLADRNGQRLANHDGGTGGFSSSLWLNLTERRAGLVLSNAQVVVADLARHLMDPKSPLRDVAAEQRALNDAQSRAVLKLTPAQLASVAGVYALNPQFKLTLRVRGDQLFAQASGQGEFELHAKSPDQFYAKVAALEVHFPARRDASAPPSLLLLQGGREMRFQREGDEHPEPLKLPAASLAELSGVYALSPAFKLTVRSEGERLFAQATGQAEFELFGKGVRHFFARITPLEIRFEGEAGLAPALRLQQAGRELRFLRE
ncbi:serine hydrolase [Inhella gelatinilytica]|uniref:Beta-lactamase family protein n=1 Tax=Inhella gelatinilytica TaxID=2795030 RepID=A0A931IUI6_9BURK|nr:serine hydrolase [Inhella gelatinilytica]MBH9553015.1 beta-lactamase family protein [Inhella gelatinilytica]